MKALLTKKIDIDRDSHVDTEHQNLYSKQFNITDIAINKYVIEELF